MARGNGPKTKQNHNIRVSKNKAELKLEQDKTKHMKTEESRRYD